VARTEKKSKEPVSKPKVSVHGECCPLFSLAYHAKGSITWGFSLAKDGSGPKGQYVFEIPAKGRGRDRVPRRCFVLNHCPFCGAPPSASDEAPVLIVSESETVITRPSRGERPE
jgi:hypothetical protein